MSKTDHRKNSVSLADSTADFFLLCNRHNIEFMTDLKLEKLCYLAQGQHLAKYGEPLFDEAIEAWMLGPVVPYLFNRFKGYKRLPLDCAPLKSNPIKDDGIFSEASSAILHEVWSDYSEMTTRQLVNLTKTHATWIEAYDRWRSDKACDKVITHAAMQNYFLNLAEAA